MSKVKEIVWCKSIEKQGTLKGLIESEHIFTAEETLGGEYNWMLRYNPKYFCGLNTKSWNAYLLNNGWIHEDSSQNNCKAFKTLATAICEANLMVIQYMKELVSFAMSEKLFYLEDSINKELSDILKCL